MTIAPVTKVDAFSPAPVDKIISDASPREDQVAADPTVSQASPTRVPDLTAIMLETQRKAEIAKVLSSESEQKQKAESDAKTASEIQAKISETLGQNAEQIQAWIAGLLSGEMTIVQDKIGRDSVVPCKQGKLMEPVNFSFSDNDIVVWPNGQAFHIGSDRLQKFCSSHRTFVYSATDLQTGKNWLANYVKKKENYEVQRSLVGKRGIGQKCLHAPVRKSGCLYSYGYEQLVIIERNESLSSLEKPTKQDLSVVVKDLLHAIIALEEIVPTKGWVVFNPLHNKVSINRDPLTKRVLSAQLWDFSEAVSEEEIDTLSAKIIKLTQRNDFMKFVFVPLLRRCTEKTTLAELCADDPICQKLIEEIETDYLNKKIDLLEEEEMCNFVKLEGAAIAKS